MHKTLNRFRFRHIQDSARTVYSVHVGSSQPSRLRESDPGDESSMGETFGGEL